MILLDEVFKALRMRNQGGTRHGDAQAPRSPLTIQLLGGFHVRVDGQCIPDEHWRMRKSKSLVKLLALAPGHRLHRDQLIDHLWPETEPKAAANLFYQALHAARQVIDPSGGQGQRYLFLQEENLYLCPDDPLVIDVEEFERQAVLTGQIREPAAYQTALEMYAGDLLPEDPYEEWAVLRRAALREQYLQLLYGLAGLWVETQSYEPATAALNRILSIDPIHEEAHVLLMRVFALAGRRRDAIQQYQKLRDALQKELGVDPSAEATCLFEEILHGRLAADERAGSAEPGPKLHNLPAHLSSFIGRENEIAEVSRLLSEHRLVTVTGAGGTGKTRLALKTAERLLGQYPHGVWLIELASVSDPDLVPRVVTETLGIPEQVGWSPAQTLAGYIQSQSILLVLDNCEHVIAAAAGLAAQILHACPHLRILATSREILGVEGEVAFYCPSLSLPDRSGPLALEEVLQSEAVGLFVERARSALPEYTLHVENAARIIEICRRVDGIPLAIELAAARTRMLSVEQIAERLDHDFRLLTSDSHTALPRHKTLKALVDWSYHLLSAEESALLRRLSVFSGGWTLEAAEQVCADRESEPPGENEPPGGVLLHSAQMVDLIGHLVDKSLIQFESSSNGEPRYRMLETVRQYAREKLAQSGEEPSMRERHLDHYLALALLAEPHLRAFGAKRWLDRLDRELDNLRQALEGSLKGPVEKGLQIAAALLWFWWIRGHVVEAVGWLVRLLQEQQDRCASLDVAGKVARGRALNVLFNPNFIQNGAIPDSLAQQERALCLENQALFQELGKNYLRDFAISRFTIVESIEEIQECRRLFQEANEPFWVGECDNALTFSFPPDDERNFFYAQEGLALAKESGDLDGQAYFLSAIGMFEFYRENKELAIKLIEEAIACFELVGNREWAARTRVSLFLFSIASDDQPAALEQLELIHSLEKELKSKYLSIRYLEYQAYAAWMKGEDAQAVRYCELAQELGRDLHSLGAIKPLWHYILGRVAISQGDLTRAKAYLLNYIRSNLYKFSWDARAVQALGVAAAKEGRMRRAALLFGAQVIPNTWSAKIESPRERSEYEQALAAARAALGEEAFTAAWEAGRAMTTQQAIQYALEGARETPEPGGD